MPPIACSRNLARRNQQDLKERFLSLAERRTRRRGAELLLFMLERYGLAPSLALA